jgi:hypothetical protein
MGMVNATVGGVEHKPPYQSPQDSKRHPLKIANEIDLLHVAEAPSATNVSPLGRNAAFMDLQDKRDELWIKVTVDGEHFEKEYFTHFRDTIRALREPPKSKKDALDRAAADILDRGHAQRMALMYNTHIRST